MTRLMLLTAVAALAGCGFVDVGVERDEARFKDGEDLMCAFNPPRESPPWTQGLGPTSRESADLLQRVCPDLKRGDIPMALLQPEETVIIILKDCRVTRIIKEEGVLVDLAPETCRSSGDVTSMEAHAR